MSTPFLPSSTSSPAPPLRVLLPMLPIRILFCALPVRLNRPAPATVTFSKFSRLFWFKSMVSALPLLT
ncbi:hypothetical protein CYD26_04920 [Pseudomonas sp. FFUP_PS_473]|nr:hypothetical protein CYD26_04920 [Pseudomonas sp. FFUP_PS_473]